MSNRFTRNHPHPVIAFRQQPRWRRIFGAWGIYRQYRRWDNGRRDSFLRIWRAIDRQVLGIRDFDFNNRIASVYHEMTRFPVDTAEEQADAS